MLQENLNLDNILEKKVRAKKTLVGAIEAKSDSFILVTSPPVKDTIYQNHISNVELVTSLCLTYHLKIYRDTGSSK